MPLESLTQKRPNIYSNGLLALLLVLSTLTYTTLNTNRVYVTILAVYAIFILYSFYRGFESFPVPMYSIVALCTIWLIFIWHAMQVDTTANITESPLIRTPVFIVACLVNLFVIPKQVNLVSFLRMLGLISAFLVLVGLPTYFFPYSVLGLTVEPYYGTHDLLGIRKLSSVILGPNAFSRFVLSGVLSTYVLGLTYDRRYYVLFAINCFGIFLGYSRATLVACAVGIFLYTIYHFCNRWVFQILSLSALTGIVVFFAMMVEVIPGPRIVTRIDASGRSILWRGAVEAWQQRPLLGLGPGNNLKQLAPFIAGTGQEGSHVHNSYLRMLMSTGIAGFCAYLYFHVQTIVTHLKMVENPYFAGVLVLIITYSINQITNIFSMFGVTITSVVLSISFGYILYDIADGGGNIFNESLRTPTEVQSEDDPA